MGTKFGAHLLQRIRTAPTDERQVRRPETKVAWIRGGVWSPTCLFQKLVFCLGDAEKHGLQHIKNLGWYPEQKI